jgi:hypothetical protein
MGAKLARVRLNKSLWNAFSGDLSRHATREIVFQGLKVADFRKRYAQFVMHGGGVIQ